MVDFKRVSIATIENVKIIPENTKKHWEAVQIPDRFYYVNILFFLLGLMHFLPYSFFVTANAYWMYKFRNVTADASDASTRTVLQSHFASASGVCTTVPFTICILMNTIYGHKIKARPRILVSLAVMTTCFFIATAFVKINTDSWETTFFVLTMFVLGVNNSFNAVLEIASLVLLAKFPPYYMNTYLLGQGFAAVFNSTLQILSLASGTSTMTSALIYFLLGSSIMGTSFVYYYFSKYNKLYNYYVEHSVEDTKKGTLPFAEAKKLLKVMWSPIVTYILFDLSKVTTHTAVTSLVVSENYGSGNSWSDTYFVPAITFLSSDFFTLIGRILASKINKVFDAFWLLAFMFVRMVVFVPLIFLCNAQPRSHLPVLLPHDWQYAVILWVFSVTNGYLFSMIFLNISKLFKPEKVEDAYMVLMSCICTLGAVMSPIGLISVNVL